VLGVDAAHEALSADGVRFVVPPESYSPPVIPLVTLVDPEGNFISLYEDLDCANASTRASPQELTMSPLTVWRRLPTLLGLAALWLGSTAGFCAPPTSHQTVAGGGGVPLLVAQAGNPDAPGILFIHGMAQSHLAFHRQFEDPGLTGRFHLVAFDLRGQGGSGKPWSSEAYRDAQVWAEDVAAVMRATGLRRPLIVGWSYGGFVTMDYVRVFGTKQIAGIALVGSLGGLTSIPRVTAGDTEVARAMRERSAAQRGLDLQAFVTASEASGNAYVTPAMTPLERRNFFASELLTPPYVRTAMTARNLDNRDLLERVNVPIRFFRGSEDLTMPPAPLQHLLDQLPGSQLMRFEGVGHLPFMEKPAQFNSQLAAFARAIEPE
jgi:pimeloyl-ACP methyl ester carboxylesterase